MNKPKTKVYLLKLKYIANIKKNNLIKSLKPAPQKTYEGLTQDILTISGM